MNIAQNLNFDVRDFREAAALRNEAESIETMIRLSLTAAGASVRSSASDWLKENCNVVVAQETGGDHATPAPANDIR